MKLNQKSLLLVSVFVVCVVADNSCRKISTLYKNGKELCENMWSMGDDPAFRYVNVSDPEYEFAYTMWFFTQINPNDQVTANRRQHQTYSDAHDADYNSTQCHLKYYHKTHPGPEPDTFTECHPWKANSCCHTDTVSSAKNINEAYGLEYQWDRCGQLTPECERFFVQEACFYECDPNAGLFRKFAPDAYNSSKADSNGHNEWQMHNMPIKGDYCDAFYTACSGPNYFCGSGSFFSCKAPTTSPTTTAPTTSPTPPTNEPTSSPTSPTISEKSTTMSERLSGQINEMVIVVVVLVTCMILCLIVIWFLVHREKQGNAVFSVLKEGGQSKPINSL